MLENKIAVFLPSVYVGSWKYDFIVRKWISLLYGRMAAKVCRKHNCRYEQNNVFDRFAIKTMKTKSRWTTGHLPVEIPKVTKFLLKPGAEVIVKLIEVYCNRRSPTPQDGLEIP